MEAVHQILLLVMVFFLLKYFRDTRFRRLVAVIPGPARLPLLGNMKQFFNLPHHKLLETIEGYANDFRDFGCFVVEFTELGSLAYLTTGETVAKLLQSRDHLGKGDGYRMISEYLGDGLVTSDPNKWKHHRNLINPAFTFKMFDNFIRVFNEQSVVMLELMHAKFDNMKGEEGFMDISSYFTRCSLDIILELCYGLKLEAQTNPLSEIHEAMEHGVLHIGTRFIKPWLRSSWVWRTLSGKSVKHEIATVDKGLRLMKNIIFQIVKDRQRQGGEPDSEGHQTLIDILLENDTSKTLTTQEVIDEAVTITSAGHDTVATAINFTFFMLAIHQEHQKGIQKELDDIFVTNPAPNGFISSAHLAQMKYLERFIKETLRLFPSVSGFVRKLESDLELDNGIILPTGINVSVFLSALHKDPGAFPNPEKFDPDRFLPENSVGRHPCAYIPFSAGPRNCIGQKFAMLEAKLLVASVLREFSVITKESVTDLKMIPSITLILVNPIKMKLVPRSDL